MTSNTSLKAIGTDFINMRGEKKGLTMPRIQTSLPAMPGFLQQGPKYSELRKHWGYNRHMLSSGPMWKHDDDDS